MTARVECSWCGREIRHGQAQGHATAQAIGATCDRCAARYVVLRRAREQAEARGREVRHGR